MKIFLSFFITAIFLVFISGCQKEITLSTASTASGNLVKNSSGDCAPMTLGGIYSPNSAVTNTHFLDVQVNFSTPGQYDIKSDTVNGYYFHTSGQATATGTVTIRLKAGGMPLAAGTNLFTIKFNNSTCKTSIVVSSSIAVYTFGNTSGNCTGATVAGNYTSGVALSATHNVSISVNVTAPGVYSINTDTVNGISFSNSGNFTTTGTQTVSLSGSGLPPTAGSFTFKTAPLNGCNFNVQVASPPASLPQLTTAATTGITCTSATSGGNITNDGGSAITARGIVYSTSANPTTANTVISAGNGMGTFSSALTGLAAGTTYHVRAFATNSAGTAYGNNVSFTATTGCQVTVYVVGEDDIYNLSGNIRTAKIWTKPAGTYTGTALSYNSGVVAKATSVFVSGTDVYVTGSHNGSALLWKNGTATVLPTSSSFYAGAESVFVSGTDVYVAGFSNAAVATVWKNGVATLLPATGYQSYAHGVFVSGTDVYVAGYDYEASNNIRVAKIWKNGVATALTNGTSHAVANDVFVYGADVYVTGFEGNDAKVWKNGVASVLPTGGDKAVGNSIFVSGGDVYVAGMQDNGTSINSYAKLWKNGVGTDLTTSGYGNSGNSVYVIGNDVYVAGTKSTGGANVMATVWRNGFATPLTSGSTDAYANGIFVK